MQYAIMPPTIDPNVAAKTTGNARFLFAIIGGVIKTSGGIKRNIDSHTVIKNTNQVYVLVSARDNRYSDSFINFSLAQILIYYTVISHIKQWKRYAKDKN